MHEIGLAQELVASCLRLAAGRPIRLLRIRYAPGVEPDVVRQAVASVAAADLAPGPLRGAAVELLPARHELSCGCGFRGILEADDLGPGVAVCPACGALHLAPRSPELELVALELADGPDADGPVAAGLGPDRRR